MKQKDMTKKQIVRGDIVIDNYVVNQQYLIQENKYALVMDCETHIDIEQKARILVFALLNYVENEPNNITYHKRGIVAYDLTEVEINSLTDFCEKNNLLFLTKHDFIHRILFPCVERGIAIVNHNIAFDLGAICTDFEVNIEEKIFRLKLCDCNENDSLIKKHDKIVLPCSIHPTVVIMPVKTKKSFMYFEESNYGAIIDTINKGNALLGSGASSLNAMVSRYGFTDDKKEEISSYGGTYNEEMFSYAVHDVELTCKLLIAEYNLYRKHGIFKPFHMLMSEASLGKAYYEKVGISPFRETHPEVRKFMFDLANQAYYGARSEAHIRKQSTLIRYVDFKSQYPLVNALLHSQDYLLAKYLRTEKCVDETREFLQKLRFEDLQDKKVWSMLPVLVKVKTNNDILPFKVKDSGLIIYGTQIVSDTTSWYCLADIVASYIRTGNIPNIIDAYKLIPYGRIETNIIQLFGDESYKVDLSKDDFFVKIIDLRDGVKAEIKQLKTLLKNEPNNMEVHQRVKYLDNLQVALKLMANSTSYGILVETLEYMRTDVAGKYNAQPIGTHITASARLLLAIAEKLGLEKRIEHVLCDTDSFAYGKSNDMSKEEFYKNVDECIAWFNPLSPFKNNDAIFELEDVNFYDGIDTELYAYAISTKRYVLYNKLEDGKYRIKKLSSHGMPRYSFDIDIDIPEDMTPIPVDFNNRRKWYPNDYCLWYRIIQYAENNEERIFKNEQWSNQLAIKQVTVSTPNIYRAMQHIPNIRPFCFFTITPYSDLDKKRDRYYMFYASNSKIVLEYIRDKKVRIMHTNEVTHNPIFDTLEDRFKDFNEHIEKKFNNGNNNGIMNRKIISGLELEKRTRSGKKIINIDNYNQEELW